MVPAASGRLAARNLRSHKERKDHRKARTSSRSVFSETRHQLPRSGHAEGRRQGEHQGGTGYATGEAEAKALTMKVTSGARASRGARGGAGGAPGGGEPEEGSGGGEG